MTHLRKQNWIFSCGCRGRRGGWLPAGVAVLCAVAAMSSARAEIVTHNGLSAAPSHPFGTDEVDVTFVSDLFPDPGVLGVSLAFSENATHSFIYAYEPPEPPLLFIDFTVANTTGVAWTGFEIVLVAGDYFGVTGFGVLARTDDPAVKIVTTDDDIFFGSDDDITLPDRRSSGTAPLRCCRSHSMHWSTPVRYSRWPSSSMMSVPSTQASPWLKHRHPFRLPVPLS